MGAVADAGATKGVLGDARATGDRERRGVADGGARVPEELTTAEFEFVRLIRLLPSLGFL